jgi:L-threonylcarbamoyladenylate synthase
MKIIKKNKKNIKEIIAALENGAVLVCPTDTVYGFLADATNKKAVDKIYKIKKRSKTKPLPVFIKDIKMAKELAEISEKQSKVLKSKWPGKYTFVLNRKYGTKLYGVDKKNIALRIPKYKFLNGLLEKFNKPLVQTSVNISNNPALAKISDIIKKFNKYDILMIDGGNLKKSKPSKIIDLANNNKIIRK